MTPDSWEYVIQFHRDSTANIDKIHIKPFKLDGKQIGL